MKKIETFTGTIEAREEGKAPTPFEARIYAHEWRGNFVTIRQREFTETIREPLTEEDHAAILSELHQRKSLGERYSMGGDEEYIGANTFLQDSKSGLWENPSLRVTTGDDGKEWITLERSDNELLPQYEVERIIFQDGLSRSSEDFFKQSKRDAEYVQSELVRMKAGERDSTLHIRNGMESAVRRFDEFVERTLGTGTLERFREEREERIDDRATRVIGDAVFGKERARELFGETVEEELGLEGKKADEKRQEQKELEQKIAAELAKEREERTPDVMATPKSPQHQREDLDISR